MVATFQLAGTVTLAPAPSSVAAARRFVAARLLAAGLDALVDTAVLLASELVTNAVLHAHSDLEVRVGVGRGARVEVRDHSDRKPVRREHAAESVVGRGLELVEMLATGYGVDTVPGDGKSVWFTVGAAGTATPPGWGVDDADDGDGATSIELLGLPVVLYEVMREHNEALVREYTLALLERPGSGALTPDDVSAAERARGRLADAVGRALAALGDRSASAPSYVDVTVSVTRADAAGFELLRRTFADAERLAADGLLLTRPALPEIRALRDWCVEEPLRQRGGAEPARWAPAATVDDGPALPAAAYDSSWVRSTTQRVIVGDDTNCIRAVSEPAARLLGWAPDDLVGERIVTVVPPRLREDHVAGFTRQLVTGRLHILGTPSDLPGWHRDGYEVPLRVVLERRTVGDRAVFLAWLDES